MSGTVANAKVVQHRATSYDTTDDPQTSFPSAELPKFSLKPKCEESKLNPIAGNYSYIIVLSL